ncbi:MAG: SGNH/GDSL hydrolase family protein [Phycisphaerae bacterium]|nr:SGNH/GDSL hydrolase family protein [Phycisphaerae bacterium]
MNVRRLVTRSGRCLLFVAVTGLLTGCNGFRVPDPDVRTIAFGDSSTDGPAEKNYWEFVQEDLGVPADWFANEGEGGETAQEGLERLTGLLADGIYPNAETLLYWQGAAGVIDFIRRVDPLLLFDPGGADYPYSGSLDEELDSVQASIEQAIETAQEAGLEVVVSTYYYLIPSVGQCDPAPLGVLLPGQAANANRYVDRLNERIRLAAQAADVTLVDVAAIGDELLAEPGNYFDCRHLSVQGNERVAELFLSALSGQAADTTADE